MKKPLSLVLALVMAFTMTTSSLAAGQTITTTGTTTVSASISSAYTINIPASTASITYNVTSTDIGDIVISGARFAPGYQITVTVSGGSLTSAGAGALKHTNNTDTLAFTLKLGGTAGTVATFTGNGTKQVDIDIASLAWSGAKAGSYSAALTFTVTYGAIPTNP